MNTKDSGLGPSRALIGSLLGFLATCAPPAAAQVGHAPDASPYRPIQARHMVLLNTGFLGGSGGEAGVGPTDGPYLGAGLVLRLGGAWEAEFGLAASELDRLLIDPDEGPDDRVLGTATQSVVLIDAGINFVLTGEKTWNGFAPYVGFALGLSIGGGVPEDSSGFSFGTKFQLGPRLGTQWHISPRVHLRLEVRDIFWRISHPPRFFNPPTNDPGAPPVLDADENSRSEWTAHPTLRITFGYAIKL